MRFASELLLYKQSEIKISDIYKYLAYKSAKSLNKIYVFI